MISCSPPASGGEHIEFFEKVELKMLEQRRASRSSLQLKNSSNDIELQDAGARRHSSNILRQNTERSHHTKKTSSLQSSKIVGMHFTTVSSMTR